jgi:hypothetical protein
MNELLKERLFSLLSEPSQESTNEEMKNAYGDFVTQTKNLSQSETDYSEVFRTLNHTRIEFDLLGLSPLYGQGGKCPKIRLSSENNPIS